MITYSCPAKGTRDRNRNRVQGRFAVEGLEERALMALAVESIRTTEGVPFSGIVATLLRSDINNADPVSCAARIVWGDGTDSLALVRSDPAAPMGAALQVVTQSPHDFPDVGSYPVTVSVTCGDTTALFAAGSATVAPRPLVLAAVPLVAVSGETFVARAVARFRTADADDRPADFEATVTVGQTAPAPATVIQNASGEFEVRFSGSFLQTGAIAATVRVIARDGASGTVNAEIAIERSPIQAAGQDVALIAGAAPSSQVLAIFTDTRADAQAADYQAFVTLPSQPQSLATVQRLSDGRFAVSASAAVATAGQITVPVRIVRLSDGLAATADAVLRVERSPISIVGQTVNLIAGAEPAPRLLAIFQDVAANPQASDYQALIVFPDPARTLSGTVQRLEDGRFGVFAPLSSATVSQFTVSVRVTRSADRLLATADANVRSDQAPIVATGQDVALVAGAAPSSQVLAIFTDARANAQATDYQAFVTLPNSTQSQTLATVQRLSDGRFAVSAPTAVATAGQFTVPVRVVRVSDGLAATATATLRADRIPINAIGQAVAVIAGAGPATRDLVVFLDGRANASAAEFQAIVTFPDQSQRLGTVRALSGGRFAVSAPVGASQAGESAVQVRITRTSDGQTAIVDALIQAANPIAPAIDLPAPGGIVRVRQFRIQGSSPSGSVILLYAQRLGQPVSEQIGRTVADASGRWSVRVGPLANGRYVIRALIAPPGQSPFEIALAGPGGETTPLTVASAKLKPHGPGRGRPIR